MLKISTQISLIVALAVFTNAKNIENEAKKLKSVTVTANKMEENIKDIPTTITLIDENAIEEKGIDNVGEILREVPNLGIKKILYGSQISFRGLNPSIFTSNNPIVLYINGIPHIATFGYDMSLTNVQRIEVLRGPQGTLYGKDAIGGVINVVTKKPKEFEGSIKAEYGTDNLWLTALNVNAPIIKDKLYLTLNGFYTQDDGWITNTYPGMDDDANGMERRNYNGTLHYSDDGWDIGLNVNHDYYHKDWKNGTIPDDLYYYWHADRKESETTSFDTPTHTEYTTNSQALNVSYEFEKYKLASITTNSKTKTDNIFDADFSDNVQNRGLIQFEILEEKSTAEELRLSSKNSEGFRWISGLYYEHHIADYKRYGQQYFNGGAREANAPSKTKTDTYSGFGQVVLPFYDFELTIGGRLQKIKKDIDVKAYDVSLGSSSATPYAKIKTDKTWNAFLPKIALSYKIHDNLMTYASIAKGYMPGGFNFYPSSSDATQNTFEPQTSVDYELGIKANLQNLDFNINAFYMDIKDIHAYFLDGTHYYTRNEDEGVSYGLEADFSYFVMNGFIIDGSLGLINAKYKGGSKDGKKIEFTPAHTARLGLSYALPFGLYTRADVYNYGKTYYDSQIGNTLEQPAYTIGNIKIGYLYKDLDIYTYVKNITDESYFVYMSDLPSDGGYGNELGDGRFFGIGFKYSF